MEWLQSNLAVLSGLLVPVLLGVVKPLMEREPGGRELRRIRRHAQLRVLLPNGGEAASRLDSLLATEVDGFVSRASKRHGRQIDPGNLATIVVVSLLGSGISFGLVTWAQSVSGIAAWVLWILFAAWTLFVLLLVFVGGFLNLYKTEEKDEEEGKE